MSKPHRTSLLALSLGAMMMACSSDDDSGNTPLQGGANAGAGPVVDPSVITNPNADESSIGMQPGASNEGADESLPLTPVASGSNEPVGAASGESPALQEPLPQLPSVRQEHAVVALGQDIYVIGGFTPNVTPTVEAFNPGLGSWRSVAEFPFALHHANAAAVDGRLYVAGFYLGASFTLASGRVFEYDPTLDEWSERGLMPGGSERASACVAALDGKIYLFGGARLGGSVTDSSVYDVVSDTWQALPPLPEAREHCVAGAIDGTLYVAAGRSGGIAGFAPNTWAFDPATLTYTARAPIPTPRGGVAGAVLDGKLHVLGGEGNPADPSGVFDEIEAYDPASDTWETLTPMLEPRHGLAAAVLDGRIYLPGGASTQGFGAVDAHSVLSF